MPTREVPKLIAPLSSLNDVFTTRICILGIPDSLSTLDLEIRLKSFIKVENIELVKDKLTNLPRGIGYATLIGTHKQIQQCISALNNSKWKGSTIRVELAKRKNEDLRDEERLSAAQFEAITEKNKLEKIERNLNPVTFDEAEKNLGRKRTCVRVNNLSNPPHGRYGTWDSSNQHIYFTDSYETCASSKTSRSAYFKGNLTEAVSPESLTMIGGNTSDAPSLKFSEKKNINFEKTSEKPEQISFNVASNHNGSEALIGDANYCKVDVGLLKEVYNDKSSSFRFFDENYENESSTMDAEKLLDNNKLSTRTTSKNPQSPQKPTEEEASSPFFFHLSDYSLQNRLLSGKECDFYNYFTCPASQRDSLEQWKDKRIKLMEMFRQARRQALKKEGMREKAT